MWAMSGFTARHFRTAVATCLTMAAALALVICAVRLVSVIHDGDWAQTTGFEAAFINLVYRVAFGLTPYADVNVDPSPAMFNGLFYIVYGSVAAVFRSQPVRMLIVLRGFSLLITGVAATLIASETWRVLRARFGSTRAALIGALAGVAVAFGPFVGWWYLTVRPDAAVFAMEIAALVMARRSLDTGLRRPYIVAVVCLAVAWGFKQNSVNLWLPLLLVTPAPRWPNRALLVAMLGVMAGALALWGGRFYLTHILLMAVGGQLYTLVYMTVNLRSAIVTGSACLLVPILELPAAFRRSPSSRLTALVFVVAILVSLPQLARIGPTRNYLLTAYIAGTLILVDAFAARDEWAPWRRWTMLAGAAHFALIPAVYLAFPNTQGRVTLSADRNAGLARTAVIRHAPGPRFVEDYVDAWPWHSGQMLIETIDLSVYEGSVSRGVVTTTIESRARRGFYGSAFVASDTLIDTFGRAGYVRAGTLPGGVVHFERPSR